MLSYRMWCGPTHRFWILLIYIICMMTSLSHMVCMMTSLSQMIGLMILLGHITVSKERKQWAGLFNNVVISLGPEVQNYQYLQFLCPPKGQKILMLFLITTSVPDVKKVWWPYWAGRSFLKMAVVSKVSRHTGFTKFTYLKMWYPIISKLCWAP